MIHFLKEHRSWLLFVFALNVAVNVLLFLDQGLANISIIYLNILYYFAVFIFCIIRYQLDNKLLHDVEGVSLTPVKKRIADYYKLQLEEKAEELHQLKWKTAELNDDLLAWVHEMKSPLTAMKLMLDELPNGAQKRKLEYEWLRLYMLLDRQLHTTRLQTIEQDSRLERVSLQRIVIQEIKGLQSWCLEKGIGVNLGDLQYEVVTDAKWLAFIIRQYLSNAVKYSPKNSEVEIETGVTEQGHLLLKVKDCGPGIPVHDLPRVFKKSYTGMIGRESSAASGMGLYLAKQAADTIGLKLYIRSNVKDEFKGSNMPGTTAVIQFPLENEYTKQFGM